MQPHVVRRRAAGVDELVRDLGGVPLPRRAGVEVIRVADGMVTVCRISSRPHVWRVRCVAELDMVTVPVIEPALVDACRTLGGQPTGDAEVPGCRLELDLSGIGFCGARGLTMLLTVGREAEPLGVDLVLVSPSRAVRRILTLTGTHESFRSS